MRVMYTGSPYKNVLMSRPIPGTHGHMHRFLCMHFMSNKEKNHHQHFQNVSMLKIKTFVDALIPDISGFTRDVLSIYP